MSDFDMRSVSKKTPRKKWNAKEAPRLPKHNLPSWDDCGFYLLNADEVFVWVLSETLLRTKPK